MKDVLKAMVFAGLFAVPFLTLYVEDNYFFPFITGKNFWFRILVDFTVIAWVLLALLDAKYRPKISGLVWSGGALLVVMFFANLFGEHPRSSFWSNFERMDGYVSLVHAFLYAFVLGSVLQTKKHWYYFLSTSLFAAFLVACYGLAQYGGLVQGAVRIDSFLGNAAYMAVYMLFHIFIAFWLFVETRAPWYKTALLLLVILFTFVLVQTGTRGTAVGLAAGILTMSAYIGLFGNKYKEFRKYAIGVFVALALAVTGFIIARDSQFVQDSVNLSRIANISLEDLTVRSTIWSAAWEGVKDRPLLGWGQGNFNYVFNQYYDPSLYSQEQWFDRAHNIVFDWLIAGGFLGAAAYFSVFLVCVWYLLVRPIVRPDDEAFTVLERGVLLGILAGYATHNLVVFDNIVSYIFFAAILGLIHSRVSVPVAAIADEKKVVSDEVVTQFAAPVALVAFGLIVYYVHVPGMAAASDIIDAFRTSNPEARLEHFKTAVDRDTFAHQEITEQLTQQAMGIFREAEISPETKQKYAEYTEQQLLRLIDEKPGDARVHVFVASYYRTTNQLQKAQEQLAIARTLSPQKQTIIQQQGFVELSLGNYESGVAYMKEAFESAPENEEAREYYIGSLMYVNDTELARELLEGTDTAYAQQRIAFSDFIASAANQSSEQEFMIELFQRRLEIDSSQAQNWATLAYLYYQVGNNTESIKVLESAATTVPAFAGRAQCFIENIEAGERPEVGC